MSTYEIEQAGKETVVGKIRAVGGAAGDVPTQQANGELLQAAGGGSMPFKIIPLAFDTPGIFSFAGVALPAVDGDVWLNVLYVGNGDWVTTDAMPTLYIGPAEEITANNAPYLSPDASPGSQYGLVVPDTYNNPLVTGSAPLLVDGRGLAMRLATDPSVEFDGSVLTAGTGNLYLWIAPAA